MIALPRLSHAELPYVYTCGDVLDNCSVAAKASEFRPLEAPTDYALGRSSSIMAVITHRLYLGLVFFGHHETPHSHVAHDFGCIDLVDAVMELVVEVIPVKQ